MLQAAVHAVYSTYSLPVLVFAFQIPLIFPISLKHIGYYGNWSVGTELGDIHIEGMLPRNLNIDWMVIRQHCIWLRFCKNPQEATEGEEVEAEVMMKETPNADTGMFCSPMTLPVTQPCDSEGEKPETGRAEPQDCSQEQLCTERIAQGYYSFCGEL